MLDATNHGIFVIFVQKEFVRKISDNECENTTSGEDTDDEITVAQCLDGDDLEDYNWSKLRHNILNMYDQLKIGTFNL